MLYSVLFYNKYLTESSHKIKQLKNNINFMCTSMFALERDGFRQVKRPMIHYMMNTPRNYLWRPRLWCATVTDVGEWWTVQHIGAPTTSSRVKGKIIIIFSHLAFDSKNTKIPKALHEIKITNLSCIWFVWNILFFLVTLFHEFILVIFCFFSF